MNICESLKLTAPPRLSVPGIRALQPTPCAPSSPHQGRPSSACRPLRLGTVGVVEPGEEGVEGQEAEVVVGTIGSTLTPACPTCSRALSKNTWTLCMSGRLKWQDQGLGTGQDTGTDPTPTHIHTPTHTGSHQPT